MTLWYRGDDRAYYHLAAYSPRGYELKASFALFWHAHEVFAREGVRWLALGAGAGIDNDELDGLTRFKSGWATVTRTAYLCGRIFDEQAYAALAGSANSHDETFFSRLPPPADRSSIRQEPYPMTATSRSKPYLHLVTHYETCLAHHGDSHLGVDWPNQPDAVTRYQIMLELIRSAHDRTNLTLLDFGCGASHLYEYIQSTRAELD